MKKMRIFQLAVFLFSVLLAANSCFAALHLDFSWLANIDDGTTGYKIYYGTSSRAYTKNHDVGLPPTVDGRVFGSIDDTLLDVAGTYYFACVAYDAEENESSYSNEVCVGFNCAEAGTNIKEIFWKDTPQQQ